MQTFEQSDTDLMGGVDTARLDRVLELIAVFTFASGLLGLLAGMFGVFSAPHVLTLSLLGTTVYGYFLPLISRTGRAPPRLVHIVLLLLVACLFRLTPYYYVLGGQDEGVYVNMAAELVRTGDLATNDVILEKIDDPAMAKRYVDTNYDPFIYLPGIYRGEGNPPPLEFQFYHLFPVFMALAGGVLGLKFSVYALTFLSLLSIVFLYRLALALSGSAKVAMATGLLVAVNPLHAFFSKFPVTEVPSVLFSSAAFAFLAIYWRAPDGERMRRWLVLSCLAMACLFTTRISGFMYVPFLLALSIASLICDEDRKRAVAVHAWVVVVLAIYAVSVFYGLHYAGTYSHAIYDASFSRLFGAQWKRPLLLVLGAIMIAWFLIWPVSGTGKLHDRLKKILQLGGSWLGFGFLLMLALGFFKLYQLGFTDRYVADGWISGYWKLSGLGWRTFLYGSLFVSAVYLSPFVWIAFFALAMKRWRDPTLVVQLLFILPFMAHISLLLWVIPYQPYYARYLLSEFVPYVLLFVACAWQVLQGAARRAVSTALVLGGIYAVGLSAMQFGKNENQGAWESLSELTAGVDHEDLVLIDGDNARGFVVVEMKTALIYSLGKQVVTMDRASVNDSRYIDYLDTKFDDLYLVSSSDVAPEGFVPERSARYHVMALEHGAKPPIATFDRYKAQLFRYRFERPSITLVPDVPVEFSSDVRSPRNWLEKGWSTLEPWGVWSEGGASFLAIEHDEMSGVDGDLQLEISMRGFVNPMHVVQRVGISIGQGTTTWVTFRYPGQASVKAKLPVTRSQLMSKTRLQVMFEMPDATSPKTLGLSADARILGFGLESIELTSRSVSVADK